MCVIYFILMFNFLDNSHHSPERGYIAQDLFLSFIHILKKCTTERKRNIYTRTTTIIDRLQVFLLCFQIEENISFEVKKKKCMCRFRSEEKETNKQTNKQTNNKKNSTGNISVKKAQTPVYITYQVLLLPEEEEINIRSNSH